MERYSESFKNFIKGSGEHEETSPQLKYYTKNKFSWAYRLGGHRKTLGYPERTSASVEKSDCLSPLGTLREAGGDPSPGFGEVGQKQGRCQDHYFWNVIGRMKATSARREVNYTWFQDFWRAAVPQTQGRRRGRPPPRWASSPGAAQGHQEPTAFAQVPSSGWPRAGAQPYRTSCGMGTSKPASLGCGCAFRTDSKMSGAAGAPEAFPGSSLDSPLPAQPRPGLHPA